MTKHPIIVVGSSNTDLVTKCPHLPLPGETLLSSALERYSGGKGANQAVAAARAVKGDPDFDVFFIGARGRDDFGEMAKHDLEKEGVDTRYFFVREGISSGVALILVDAHSGENCIAVTQSANNFLEVKDVARAKELFHSNATVLCQLETPIPTVLHTAQMAHQNGCTFILNPAPAQVLPEELYPLISFITPNEKESLILTQTKDVDAAALSLHQKGCPNVVITLGKKGALLLNKDGRRIIPAEEVEAVDTTGAGDCFNGVLAAALAQKLPLDEAVKAAVKAATKSVMQHGARG